MSLPSSISLKPFVRSQHSYLVRNGSGRGGEGPFRVECVLVVALHVVAVELGLLARGAWH